MLSSEASRPWAASTESSRFLQELASWSPGRAQHQRFPPWCGLATRCPPGRVSEPRVLCSSAVWWSCWRHGWPELELSGGDSCLWPCVCVKLRCLASPWQGHAHTLTHTHTHHLSCTKNSHKILNHQMFVIRSTTNRLLVNFHSLIG